MSLSLRLMNSAFDFLTNGWGKLSYVLSPVVQLSPLVLRIRITNKCNLSCHYCYVGESLNKKIIEPLSLEEWKKIFRGLPANTLIDITGGEPFLTPGIEEMLELLFARKMKVSLITNGTIYREELLKKLVQGKLAHFMISLDGPEHLHDSIRGRGSFAKAMRTASQLALFKKQFEAKSPAIVAKVTLTEENFLELESFCDSLLHGPFDGITINLLFQNEARDGFADAHDPSDKKFQGGNTIVFGQEKAAAMAGVLKELLKRFPGQVQVRPEMSPDELESYFLNPKKLIPKSCHKYRSVITLYSDGVLTPCDLGLNVGNVRELNYRLGEAVHFRKMQDFYRYFESRQDQFPGCGGCCLKKHQLIA